MYGLDLRRLWPGAPCLALLAPNWLLSPLTRLPGSAIMPGGKGQGGPAWGGWVMGLGCWPSCAGRSAPRPGAGQGAASLT